MNATAKELDVIFPLPCLPPSPLCPDRFPGITHETKVAVTKALKRNHEERHAFVNEYGFHNHASHQLLAVFAMGGPAPIYDLIYGVHVTRTRPAFKSPGAITEDNFYDHLQDRRYYDAYLHFFHRVVLEKGAAATIQEYILAPSANFPEGKAPRHMLNRLFARLFHPMIYIGYGLEFGIPGLAAEGLAQVACHLLEDPNLLSPSDFQDASVSGVTEGIRELLANEAAGVRNEQPVIRQRRSVHAFTVLARILADDRFSPSTIGLAAIQEPGEALGKEALRYYAQVDRDVSQAIADYARDWLADELDPSDANGKVEELCWTSALLYGVGGWGGRQRSPAGTFNADFFLMHTVTSSIFLQSFVTRLSESPTSVSLLLRMYFRVSLAWWIARGRPALPIRDFYIAVSATPASYGADGSIPANGHLALGSAAPNPWLPIIQGTITHSDDHLAKLQRALVHFASRYGDRPVGYFAELGKEGDETLEGAELLDGSLFIRVAGLTAKRIAEQEAPYWDYDGFFP